MTRRLITHALDGLTEHLTADGDVLRLAPTPVHETPGDAPASREEIFPSASSAEEPGAPFHDRAEA